MSSSFESICSPVLEESLVLSAWDGILAHRAEAHRALLEVPAEAFTDHRSSILWSSLQEAYSRARKPQIFVLREIAQSKGHWTSDEAFRPISDWLSSGQSNENPETLARTVLELYQRRQLHKIFLSASDRVQNRSEDHSEIAQTASRDSLDILAGRGHETIQAGDSILRMVEKGMRFRQDQTDLGGKLIHFGIKTLDENVRASAGNLIIIAGRPGQGKTALAIQAAWSSALAGCPTLFVSLELDAFTVQARLASWITDSSSGSFWAGTYPRGFHILERLKEYRDTLNLIHVWDAPALTPWSRIEAKIRGAALKGIKTIIIDYFGLIKKPGGKGTKAWEDASALSGSIRALTKNLGIGTLLLCQLNREGEKGEAPTLEQLRESGSLEQDAQTVLSMYTHEKKTGRVKATVEEQDPTVPVTKIVVLKNRDGRMLTLDVDFNGATNQIREK